ncbi:hypothetical protein LINGRAHAP2_LOCUS30845 [Linum grandiflorum]
MEIVPATSVSRGSNYQG